MVQGFNWLQWFPPLVAVLHMAPARAYVPAAMIKEMPGWDGTAPAPVPAACPQANWSTDFAALSSGQHLRRTPLPDIALPTGRVLVKASAEVGILTIPPGSTLIFDDVPGLTLKAHSIVVQGSLIMGAELCRLQSEGIGIELYGTPDHAMFDANKKHSKGIVVETGGVLRMFGATFTPTWTRLADSALSGSTSISLRQPVNWEVGQTIVVVTTAFRDEAHVHQNEECQIASVSFDGQRITLETPLIHDHYGGTEYAAEVALLSRRVFVRGDVASEGSKYGGHILCSGGSTCRISSVQAYRMGQQNLMGRYPFHLHMMGDVGFQSYFEDSVVKHSYFRAYTVHGTSSARVSRNVAYDIQGSAYYLEDGSEESNIFEYNLAAYVHLIGKLSSYNNGQVGKTFSSEPSRIVPTDATAVGFYCTNAKNHWVGNSASGGFAGFHFPEVPKALGLSYSQNPQYQPDSQELLEFDSNTAHSSGYFWNLGACIYIGGALWEDTPGSHHYTYTTGRNQPGRRSGHMLFKNTKTFACRQGVLFWGTHWAAREPGLMLEGFEAHDVFRSSAMLGNNYMHRAVISAHTANTASDLLSSSEGFELYDTDMQTILSDVVFRNFDRDGDHCIQDMTHANIFKQQGMFSMKGISFENVPSNKRFRHVERYAWDTYHQDECKGQKTKCPGTAGSSQTSTLIDVDGSGVGWSSGEAILGADDAAAETNRRTNEWWLLDGNCQHRADWGFYVCPTYGQRAVVSLYMVTGLHDSLPQTVKTRWGSQAVRGALYHFGHMDRKIELGLAGSPMITGPCCDIGWYMQMVGNVAERQLTFYLDQMVVGPQGLIMATSYPAGATFTIQRCLTSCVSVKQAGSLQQVLDSVGDKYFFDSEYRLFLKFVDETNTNPFQGGGVSQLRNKRRFQNGKGIRYKLSSSFSGSGLATFSLPEALPGAPSVVPTPAPQPTPAPPPTLAPTPVPTDGSCSTGAYENCLTSKCCQDLGFLCYQKDQYYAQCRSECQPGINPDDPPQYRTPWSCNVLGELTPVPTAAPTPAPTDRKSVV